MNQEELKAIQHLCKLIENDSSVRFDGRNISINQINDKTSTEYFLKLLDIAYDFTGDNYVELTINSQHNNRYIFYNIDDYFKRSVNVIDFEESEIIVFSNGSDFLVKEKKECFSKEKAAIFNYNSYRILLDFLLTQTDFLSYKNDTEQEFVLLNSGAGHGVLRIGYNPLESRVTNLDDFSNLVDRLKGSFGSKEYQIIFKEAIFQNIEQFNVKDRFYNIVQSLAVLLSVSDLNYEIHLTKFSFESIKAKFKEEKNKYFESIDKSLEGITKQITSIPLTYSATAFASYQVKDKPFILFFIFVACSLYTFIAWKVANISFATLKQVSKDVSREETEIKKISTSIASQFVNEYTTLREKIKRTKWLVFYFRAGLIIFLILLLCYICYEIINLHKDQLPIIDFKLT